MGLSNLVMLPVMAGMVLFAASDFEETGGYVTALSVCSIGFAAAIGCLLLSNRSAEAK